MHTRKTRKNNTKNQMRRAIAVLLVAGSVFAAPAFAGESHFIKIVSHRPFSGTVRALKEAAARNNMKVMARVNQSKVLAMTGHGLQGEAFLIGNPVMGKKAFSVNLAAGAVLPARMYVWTQGAHTYVGYFEPSSLLTQISPGLRMMGGILDKKFATVARQATE